MNWDIFTWISSVSYQKERIFSFKKNTPIVKWKNGGIGGLIKLHQNFFDCLIKLRCVSSGQQIVSPGYTSICLLSASTLPPCHNSPQSPLVKLRWPVPCLLCGAVQNVLTVHTVQLLFLISYLCFDHRDSIFFIDPT